MTLDKGSKACYTMCKSFAFIYNLRPSLPPSSTSVFVDAKRAPLTASCYGHVIHSMRHFYFSLLFLWLLGVSSLQADVPSVIVTVPPHKFFVEQIAKHTVDVILMVPVGASAHTYEPTAKQMGAASRASIWFRTGEPFEERAIQALKSHAKGLTVVDLRQGLNLIYHSDGIQTCRCCQGGCDLHFWLSPEEAKKQAATIAKSLSEAYPAYANFYQDNLLLFQADLARLQEKIRDILAPLHSRHIVVSHPAYAYFCRDFCLKQWPIEIEGKDPTPRQMTALLLEIKAMQTKSIFIQMQYNNKAAKLIADMIGARLVVLDPYSEHYFDAMLEIANAFAKS